MTVDRTLEEVIIARTHRVPLPDVAAGDGAVVTRQLDSVLVRSGFKLAGDLMGRLSAMPADAVLEVGAVILRAVRQITGDHVRHNPYFRDFPFGVPDTMTFWMESLRLALLDPVTTHAVEFGFVHRPASGGLVDTSDTEEGKTVLGWLNLLSLPNYGVVQHSYEEMLAAHAVLEPLISDRVTVLHAGSTTAEEAVVLYRQLAGSTVPLSEEDLKLLADFALFCAGDVQPDSIPVRENRAVINRVRLLARKPVLADTVTDVLRLACAASGGDVTLEQPTRFRSFARPERRLLLAALDAVVTGSAAKLGDVGQYAEPWKRLAERLHPHEYPQYPRAQEVFAVARGDQHAQSFAGRVEQAFLRNGAGAAAAVLEAAPGRLWRSLDRLLRYSRSEQEIVAVASLAMKCAPDVSGRVLLSVAEHLANRTGRPTDVGRVFVNRKGRARMHADTRPALDLHAASAISNVVGAEITRRLPDYGHVLVDPAILTVALPLSGKGTAPGFGVMPRGSTSVIDGEILRFFCYWKQRSQRTDYDLSALLLDSTYTGGEHVSWTSYHAGGYATYSGDITDAPDGATEFIDVKLRSTPRQVIIPQVHLFSGEGFAEAEESFFGFMTRAAAQRGAPFEARTVRMKSEMRGAGRVALPVAFRKGEDGKWYAKWLNLYLLGAPAFNTVEGGRISTTTLTRGIMERDYLRVGYLTDLLRERGDQVTVFDGTMPEGPVTWLGLERPDGLPAGSKAITLANLAEVIPQ